VAVTIDGHRRGDPGGDDAGQEQGDQHATA
jgi:hypothetical protein